MKVIGIDPGLTATGYSIIDNEKCICVGTIRPKKNDTDNKVLEICKRIKQLIKENRPDFAALEKVFYHKNVQTLIKSSQLRGAIILTLLENKIKVSEYAPTQVKLTTTGNGRASKIQVRYFVERIMSENTKRKSNHAIDAIAIAYTAIRKTTRKL